MSELETLIKDQVRDMYDDQDLPPEVTKESLEDFADHVFTEAMKCSNMDFYTLNKTLDKIINEWKEENRAGS